jgi:hypothetical protein
MSVHQPSSMQFGNAMGVGWKEALEHKFDKVKVSLNYPVRDTKKRDISDIDFILMTDCELSLYEDIFPKTKLNIRPSIGSAAAAHNSNCFVAEIKRSMNTNCNEKVDQFVRFYSGLFGGKYTFKKADNSIVKSSKSLFGDLLNEVVANSRTQLLFVFNGEDIARVQTVMLEKINKHLKNDSMMIHGHPVICVWCDSAELIKWKEIMQSKEKDEIIEQKDEIIEQKDEIIEQKDEIIEQKDETIKQLKEELKRNCALQEESGRKKKKKF